MTRVQLRSASTLTVIALFAVAVSILLLANEVRYQGCVGRIDTVQALNIAAKSLVREPPACSRLPFAA